MLSVNGSPLANPLNLDLSTWLDKHREDIDNDEPESMRGKGGVQAHKRTNSIIVRSKSSTLHPGPPHTRAISNPSLLHTTSKSTGFIAPRGVKEEAGDKPVAALVSVPTADGHLLEFDPFRTSPGEIDALEGITNSAKKKAKEDMRSLVKQAVERWRID